MFAERAPPSSWYVIVVNELIAGFVPTHKDWLSVPGADVIVNLSSGNTIIWPVTTCTSQPLPSPVAVTVNEYVVGVTTFTTGVPEMVIKFPTIGPGVTPAGKPECAIFDVLPTKFIPIGSMGVWSQTVWFSEEVAVFKTSFAFGLTVIEPSKVWLTHDPEVVIL